MQWVRDVTRGRVRPEGNLPSDTTKIKHSMASLKRGRVSSDAADAHTENSTIQNSPSDAVNSMKLA